MTRKLLRDAVHGDIELGPLEIELIDTPEFQRLRGIKQLGTAYLVFPSAVHTRFEHSIGAFWMARRVMDAIRRAHDVSAEEERLIRISALLHDIMHIPFGHTLEDERRVLPRHDKDEARVDYFLRDSSVGRILAREGLQDKVIATLKDDRTFIGDIVSGAISADLLDYLRRDTYFCGLAQYYDERIFESFIIQNGRLTINLEKQGMLRRDALSELVNLLRIRYTLSERVYFHHTKISSGAMISKAVELALRDGLKTEELRTLKDETLIWILRERYSGNPAIAHMLNGLESRRLYKACYILTVNIGEEKRQRIVDRFHYSVSQREEAETTISRAAGIEPHHVIVYCPSFGMSLPEADVLVRMEGGNIVPLSDSNNEEIRILKDKHKALWKFYVLIDRSGVGETRPRSGSRERVLGSNTGVERQGLRRAAVCADYSDFCPHNLRNPRLSFPVFMISSTFFFLFSQLGVGMVFTLLFISPRSIGNSFFKFASLTAAILMGVTLGFNYLFPSPVRTNELPVIFLAVSTLLTAIYNRVVDVDKFTAASVLLVGATVTGLISIVADSFAFNRLLVLGGWENWMLVVNHLAATGLLGSVMLTMVFGHWYLVIPRLSIEPLELLTKVLMGAIAIRIVSIVATLAVVQFEQVVPFGVVLRELMVRQGIFFWPRLIFGVIVPIVLAAMIWSTVRIRHTQAATGLLYLAVVALLFGEFFSKFLLFSLSIPL